MKKSSALILLIALLAMKSVKPYYDGGLDYILTDGNDDPNSCILNISYTLHSNRIALKVTTIKNSAPDCTHHNFQHQSYFRGDQLNANVTMVPNGNVANGNLTVSTIQNFNGTACMYDGLMIGNIAHHECLFKFNNIFIILTFGINKNTGNIATSWTGLLNPMSGATKQVWKQGYNIWKPNSTFPQVVGMASTSCANQWGNRFTSLSQTIYLTGTNLASNNINLHDYFEDYKIAIFWIRPTNNTYSVTQLPYTTFFVPFDWYAFAVDQGVCYDMGVQIGNFLTSLNYCQNGCAVSGVFLKVDGPSIEPYLGQTNGFTTVPSRVLRT